VGRFRRIITRHGVSQEVTLMGFSYRKALRIAKTVKLQLASGAEGLASTMTAQDRDKLYRAKARSAPKSFQDKYEKDIMEERLLKNMGSGLV
jgi:hypothetical protein